MYLVKLLKLTEACAVAAHTEVEITLNYTVCQIHIKTLRLKKEIYELSNYLTNNTVNSTNQPAE